MELLQYYICNQIRLGRHLAISSVFQYQINTNTKRRKKGFAIGQYDGGVSEAEPPPAGSPDNSPGPVEGAAQGGLHVIASSARISVTPALDRLVSRHTIREIDCSHDRPTLNSTFAIANPRSTTQHLVAFNAQPATRCEPTRTPSPAREFTLARYAPSCRYPVDAIRSIIEMRNSQSLEGDDDDGSHGRGITWW